ncbi:MAG: MBL fold metallo-hydrolase [Clostridiaceae bacterium]|nr:MBL fold metallo-hydrolase [Clostridiaceae bacterium]
MIIKVLAENTSICEKFGCEHGLSLYIETQGKKILFDVGASDLFYENAKKLNVNIADVDFLIISHGHYDHGGGLEKFLEENKTAEVFIHKLAFEKHYVLHQEGSTALIELDEKLKLNKQIILTSDRFFIGKGIQVFSNIEKRDSLPVSNRGLLAEQNGQMVDDSFAHEQNLIIEKEGKTILFTGCAHNGIKNIIEHFYKLKGRMPDFVIGGFHLSRSSGISEPDENIDGLGRYLLNTGAKYYTCHCTGVGPYNRLKAIMGDYIEYLSAGVTIGSLINMQE